MRSSKSYVTPTTHLIHPKGMGVTTVTAARILKGQMAGKTGEETSLAMDTFPYLALSKVLMT